MVYILYLSPFTAAPIAALEAEGIRLEAEGVRLEADLTRREPMPDLKKRKKVREIVVCYKL